MSTGLDAARRRFPSLTGQIEVLIRQNEDFSELCNDLAAAEAALVAVEDLAPALAKGGLPSATTGLSRCRTKSRLLC